MVAAMVAAGGGGSRWWRSAVEAAAAAVEDRCSGVSDGFTIWKTKYRNEYGENRKKTSVRTRVLAPACNSLRARTGNIACA